MNGLHDIFAQLVAIAIIIYIGLLFTDKMTGGKLAQMYIRWLWKNTKKIVWWVTTLPFKILNKLLGKPFKKKKKRRQRRN